MYVNFIKHEGTVFIWDIIKNAFGNAMDTWELKAGDVLICHKRTCLSPIRAAIKSFTSSEYTHAAIALGNNKIADSIKPRVRITKAVDFFNEYDHVAVFRRDEYWDSLRATELNAYIETLVEESSKYNAIGAMKAYTDRNKENSPKLYKFVEYLDENFNDQKEQEKFFCSQLVVQCFIEVGIIDESVTDYSTFLNPKLVYLIDLSKDSIFGFHYKYIKFKLEYEVPENDEFTHITKYKDVSTL